MKDFKYTLGAVLVAGVAIFSGCKKDHDDSIEDDVTNPGIEILRPTQNEIFAAGDTINYEVKFTDQGGLGLYTMDLRQTAKVARLAEGDPVEFQRYTSGNNHGFTDIVTGSYIIPKGAYAGTYTLTVNASDHIGNEATETLREIIIENEIENVDPVITFNSPEALTQYTTGDIVPFSAAVSDNYALDNVAVTVTLNDTGEELFSTVFTSDMLTTPTTLDLALPLVLTDAYPRGTYSITVVATDSSQNITRETLPILVHYDLEE